MTRRVKRQIRQMTSEAMREVGVLLVVFAPLDALFARGALTARGITVTVVIAISSFIGGLFLGLER